MSEDTEQSLAEVASRIFVVRGKRAMLDSELAKLYGIETRVLNTRPYVEIGKDFRTTLCSSLRIRKLHVQDHNL